MIFVLHYILFSSGLSFVIILTALFLQTYSEASMSEIGALLMALPFISILARPFFCALADRHQAHQLYLVGACFTLALGYGSLAIAPFFPDFIRHHGRLVWYLDMVGIIIGYSAFSVVFSLGDALALNAARKRGISWSLYRVWSTLSWGVFGYIIGLINETPWLPKYVPGIFVLICSMLLEMILVGLWDKSRFDMADQEQNDDPRKGSRAGPNGGPRPPSQFNTLDRKSGLADIGPLGADNSSHGSPFGTLSGPNARLMGALAGMVVEDIGSSLRSSLKSRMGGQQKRAGLSEMLGQHAEAEPVRSAAPNKMAAAGLARQMSLVVGRDSDVSSIESSGRVPVGSISVARSLGQKMDETAQAALAARRDSSQLAELAAKQMRNHLDEETGASRQTPTYDDDLQVLLLKFIVRRDKSIVKSLISFTCFGFLMSVYASYFFLHVEEVCRRKGFDFSKVMGAMVAAQSASEIFSFLVMTRYYMPLVGQRGSLITCALLFSARFLYYGTYFAHFSPYLALITESFHGFAYGMIYTLVCDCASDCVEQVGQYLPELKARGLIDGSVTVSQLKLPLRATMQGVFSGAFDGLGYGLGALYGGLYLDLCKSYTSLWQSSALISGLTILYILITHSSKAATSEAPGGAEKKKKKKGAIGQ